MKWVCSAVALLVTSAAYSSDLSTYPQPLADALSRTYEAPETAVWRFTLDIDVAGETMQVRFDGTQPDGADWTLVSPANADALDGELAEMWSDMNTANDDEEEADGSVSIGRSGLFFDAETAAMIAGDVELVEGVTFGLSYRFQPVLETGEENDGMDEFLDGEVRIAPLGHVDQIRIFAPRSFKPHPAARIHSFEMLLGFEQIEGLPAPVMTSMSTQVDVSALFQRQQQDLSFRFSDVEYVEP
ncbi:hypothetical protein V0U79_02160 [Hyphobacterium sp. HN65]|uniref:DUF3108 domain-containing protein n=1 Tax=Hyphobacterium lacteum TaxID=3116575 RepID=A0ABU7LMK1_9PROT|nr:hypothetical protein [Hyphobacterium sp. HN65]MEE2525153.1 hypothetical protein [Hyphobacterium sp. HN65]